tara:strand:- start:4441 stop:4578 length:138 start_codon:yes stop_codon:yes gene_type:complete
MKKDKIIMYKELHFVYIVDGERFLDKEKATKRLDEINKEVENGQS